MQIVIFLLLFQLALPLQGSDKEQPREKITGPHFDDIVPTNLTVQQGDTAYLQCKIYGVANYSVSWVRTRDSHIITVDDETFISDSRFVSIIQKLESLWTLQIRYVGARDAGLYLCQVSSVNRTSRLVNLKVVVPEVHIVQGSAVYVREGSSMHLDCVVSHSLVVPQFVMWEHAGELMPSTNTSFPSPSLTRARLSLPSVMGYMSGNYSCHPDNIHPASVYLHVVRRGDKHLAVTNNGPYKSPGTAGLFSVLVLLLLRI